MELTLFERDVVAAFLGSLQPPMPALAEQLRSADVSHRELTGVGFYTTFSIPSTAPRAAVAESDVRLTNVDATIEGLRHGAGFVLYITDGLLDTLEGYTYDERWPDEIKAWQLSSTVGSS